MIRCRNLDINEHPVKLLIIMHCAAEIDNNVLMNNYREIIIKQLDDA